MKCPRCQQENPPQAKFCLECGASFKAPPEGGPPAASSADLQRALSDALEQQAATSEILRVISSSPTDTQPVFDTIAANAARLCAASDAQVLRVEGDVLKVVSAYGSPSMPPMRSISRGHAVGRAVIDRQTIHVRDMAQAIREFPETSAPQHGVESILAVPLLRKDVAVGVIRISRTQIEPFTDAQITLLQTFADQAVIAIENVRLFKELETRNRDLVESLDQQTATSEILRVISQSPTDVQPVLDTIAESAMRLFRAWGSTVLRFDGELVHVGAIRGGRPDSEPYVRQHYPMRLTGDSFATRAIKERAIQHVPDIERDPNETGREVLRGRGARAILAVPMLRGGEPVGAINVVRVEPGPFAPSEITLLQTFADQAVIAVENVRLFTELQEKNRALTQAHAQVTEALEQQTATSEILRVISGSPTDVQPSFDAIAAAAATLCAAQNAGVFRFDGTLIHLAAHHHWTAEDLDAMRRTFPLPPGRGSITARAILSRSLVHVRDITEDPEYEASAILQARVSRATLSVPMLRDGHPIGAITVARREAVPFTDTQIALLETFARQAVIAIENVRLFTELQEKNRALTEAHGRVTEALEQQTATSEILQTIAQAQADVQPVFDTIVQSAARLCHAANAAVFLTDGRMVYEPANFGGSPEALAATRARFPRPVGMDSTPGIAILTRSVFHVPDTEDSSVIEHLRQSGRLAGFRSAVTVPMVREGEAVGAILVARRAPGPFSDAEVGLLKTFADQAVIAVENVRLFNETKEALEQQRASGEILGVISSSPTDVQPVFDVIVQSAVRLCGGLHSNVYRVEDGLIHLVAHHNFSPAALEHLQRRFPRPVSQGEGLAVRVIREGILVHLRDAQTDPEVPETTRRTTQALGARSVLYVPMLRDRVGIGVIVVSRGEVKPFSDKEIALIRTFADQAVIAIENVRLFKELQARNQELTVALARQTATSEVLAVISGAQTDVQPVFEAIVQNARRLCDASYSSVYRLDGQLVHLIAHNHQTPDAAEVIRRAWPMPLTGDSFVVRAIRDNTIVHADSQDDRAASPALIARARALAHRRALVVPMVREGQPIGAIRVSRGEATPFTEQHIALLKTFADQAVIAIENVRLVKELEARTAALTRSVEQLTALGEVGRAVSSTLDLETVLTTIVSRAVQLSGLDGGVVLEYDEGAEEFVQRAQAETGGALAAARRATRIRKGEGVVGQTAITLEPVQVPDITLPGAYVSPNRENLIESGIRAIVAVPMVREGQLIGCLGVTRNQPGEFPTETIELLRTFATQSALAIQNARLFHEIEDKSRQLEAASRHKSEFLANMSHELRTPLNAVIGFSEVLSEGMFGELNEKQEEYLKDIHASGQHLLSLINDILDLSKIEAGRMELDLTDFDLLATLDNALTLVRERAGRHGIALHMTGDDRVEHVRADERKIKQVILNLLSNAIKFTPDGGRIDVRALPGDGVVEVSVSDTGVGIAPEDQEAIFEEFRQVGTAAKKVEGTGLGLALSRKFIELHGGRIWVESQIGVGSTFTFTIPVRRDE